MAKIGGTGFELHRSIGQTFDSTILNTLGLSLVSLGGTGTSSWGVRNKTTAAGASTISGLNRDSGEYFLCNYAAASTYALLQKALRWVGITANGVLGTVWMAHANYDPASSFPATADSVTFTHSTYKLRWNRSNSKLEILDGSTVLADVTAPSFVDAEIHRYDFQFTPTKLEFWVKGVQVTATGTFTLVPGGNVDISTMAMSGSGSFGKSVSVINDITLNDPTGSAPDNTYPGDVKYRAVQQNTAGTYNEWQDVDALAYQKLTDVNVATLARNALTGEKQSLNLMDASTVNPSGTKFYTINQAYYAARKVGTHTKKLYGGTKNGVTEDFHEVTGVTSTALTRVGPSNPNAFANLTEYNAGEVILKVDS